MTHHLNDVRTRDARSRRGVLVRAGSPIVLLLPIFMAFAVAAAPRPADPALQRGAWIAAQDCGVCHAIGLDDVSANPNAPPFRELRLRFNPIALERRLHPMPATGHFEMPPQSLAAADVPDLVAYIQSLEPRR